MFIIFALPAQNLKHYLLVTLKHYLLVTLKRYLPFMLSSHRFLFVAPSH